MTLDKNWVVELNLKNRKTFDFISANMFIFRIQTSLKLQFDFLFAFSKFAIKIKSRHWKLFSFKSRFPIFFFANCFGRYKSSLTFMWKDKAILSFPKIERVQLTRGVINEFLVSIKHSLCYELTSPVTKWDPKATSKFAINWARFTSFNEEFRLNFC